MKKVLLIVGNREFDKNYKILRLKEEFAKKGIKADVFSSVGALIEPSFFNNLELNNYLFAYFIDNCYFHSYIKKIFEKSKEFNFFPATDFNFNDKFHNGIFLSSVGIQIPKTLLLTSRKRKDIKTLVESLGGFPCILKKVNGSAGNYVGLAKSVGAIKRFARKMPHGINGIKNILLQEFIKESKGTDFRVLCLGDKILGGIKRSSQGRDFRANVSLGGKAEIIEVNKELAEISKKIMRESGLFYAGLDFIKSNKGYLAIEINTCAQFEGFERATGLNIAEKIVNKLLEISNK